MAQVDIHLLRVLVDEVKTLCLCLLLIGNLTALQDQRHILVTLTDLTQQFQTSLSVAFLHV